MRKIMLLLTVTFLTLSFGRADKPQQINISYNGTVQFGYRISINDNPKYPYLIFRTITNNKIKAIYQYKTLNWIRVDRGFDKNKIDLSLFYGNKIVTKKPTNKYICARNRNKERSQKEGAHNQQPTHRKKRIKTNLKYISIKDGNKKLIPDYSLNRSTQTGFYTIIGRSHIYFKHAKLKNINIGSYNYLKKQWEMWKLSKTSWRDINLSRYFKNMSRQEAKRYSRYNPTDPNSLEIDGLSKYNYSQDQDFRQFMRYLKNIKTKQKTIDSYLRLASIPDNRRRMQSYFNKHKRKPTYKHLQIFKNNRVVPLCIINMIPRRPTSALNRNFNKTKFKNEVQQYFSHFFHKPFRVKTIDVKVNYRALGTIPKGVYPLKYQREYLAKTVDRYAGRNTLILYHFIDIKRLAKFRRIKTSNPMGMGAGVQNWRFNAGPAIHEFGHALLLSHHFKSANPEDIHEHTSGRCVMNYELGDDQFCEICRYALGIGK